jgi:cell division septation protein DedD
MSLSHGPSAKFALTAALLLLSGCEAIYDDTKGWANRLEASILKTTHEMAEETPPQEPSAPLPDQVAEADADQTPSPKPPMIQSPEPLVPVEMQPMDAAALPPSAMAGRLASREPAAAEPGGLVAATADSLLEPAPAAEVPPGAAARDPAVPKLADKHETAAKDAAAPAQQVKADDAIAMVLHLSSLRSEAAAKREWSELQHVFPERLSGMDAEFRRTELGDKGTFYRLLAGPLPSKSAAKEACAALKAKDAKQYCRILPSKPKGES